MLEFTASQLDAIGAGALERYKRALVAYFREQFPKQSAAHDEASHREIVSRAVDAGLRLRIRSSDAMARFVALAVLVDESCVENQEVRAYFAFSGVDPDQKAHMLAEAVIDRLGG